jgi:hypothetical protein
VTANRMRASMSAMFRWAMTEELAQLPVFARQIPFVSKG